MRSIVVCLTTVLSAFVLMGCSVLDTAPAPAVNLVAFEPTFEPGTGAGFVAALQVDNPSTDPLRLDGLTFNLLLDDYALASGVSNTSIDIPPRGRLQLNMPVSVPTSDVALLFLLGMADGLPYVARGETYRRGPVDEAVPYGGTGVLRLTAAPAGVRGPLPRYRAVQD